MKKRGKKVLALMLASTMFLQSSFVSLADRIDTDQLRLQQAFMNSNEEIVYREHYDGSARSMNFDTNWKFMLGDTAGAGEKNFNDSSFKEINLPHDYSIEQEFNKNLEAESGYLPGGAAWYRKTFVLPEDLEGKRVRIDFDGVYMNSTVYINGHKLGDHPYGYTPFSYDLTPYLEFGKENVVAVKVNHQLPSSRWYSGSGIYRSVNLTITNPLHVDLFGVQITTPDLKTKRENPTVHVKTSIKNKNTEKTSFTLKQELYKKGEASVLQTKNSEVVEVEANTTKDVELDFTAYNPELWSVDNPNLYTLKTIILAGEEVVDEITNDFGFRYMDWNSNTGFSLNGEPLKLQGVCMHHDQGALGSVANETAIRRQVEILKEMGTNSIRVTHNPASSALLKACDELGILVIDELFDGWHSAKNGNSNDYSAHFSRKIGETELLQADENEYWHAYDTKIAVKRGFNSPSIIMWSISNEVTEGAAGANQTYVDNANKVISAIQSVDTSRYITIGDNKTKGNNVGESDPLRTIGRNITNAGGSYGMNYTGGGGYDSRHQYDPNWLLYASETASSINSRGIYKISGYQNGQNGAKQLTSYDKSKVSWGAYASSAWYDVIQRDFIAGEYVWTGFDYIGEPTPYNGTGGGAIGSWPSPKNSYFGIIDTAGLPKDSYYFYRSQWQDKDTTLHILPAWNEDVVDKGNNNEVEVVVYSNAKSVRLFLTPENGQAREIGFRKFTEKTSNGGNFTYQMNEGEGKSNVAHENLYLTFRVPYEAGELKAVAYSDEAGTQIIPKTVGRNVVKTTKDEAKLAITPYDTDRKILADGKDLMYIEISVEDEKGNIVPDAANKVDVDVHGEGKLVGLDNGSAPDHTSYKESYRNTFSGKLVAIVQSTKEAGEVEVTVSSNGLESATYKFETVSNEMSHESEIKGYKYSKNYFVKKGTFLELPEEVEVYYNDGTTNMEKAIWENIPKESLDKIGSFSVKGRVADNDIYVNVSVIDDVAGVLNYSTTTQIGVIPSLPKQRPVVLGSGEVLNLNFDVAWDQLNGEDYNEEQTVVVNGTTTIFGEAYPVTASIRVQKESIVLGESIQSSAHLSQDIGGKTESDTLEAIQDGAIKAGANNSGGANKTLWSNWAASQNGEIGATLTFVYDTQVRFGQIDIYFAKDSNALRYPEAGTTEIQISDDGIVWENLEATEEISQNEVSTNVKRYTYKFAPTTATQIRFHVKNNVEASASKKPCIGITEIDIKKAVGSYNTYTTAALEKLVLNEKEVLGLTSYKASTPALFIKTKEIVTKENASATFAAGSKESSKAFIILESEDGRTRKTFEIACGADETDSDPNDASRDYDYTKMKLTAGNSQPEEPASRAMDGDTGTIWHTNWKAPTEEKDRWICAELEEEILVDGFRYYARNDGPNGRVTKYKVFTSLDGTEWNEATSGDWASTGGYKLATFSPVRARFVKLQGIKTDGDGGRSDYFMSAEEIRVKVAEEKVDISNKDLNVVAQLEKDHYVVDTFKDGVEPQVTLTVDGEEIEYGIDYKLKYENNKKVGTAYVRIIGILDYTGEIRLPFKILSTNTNSLELLNVGEAKIDGITENERSLSIETGQQVEVKARENSGETFIRWQVNPNNLVKDVTASTITFDMPDTAVKVEGIYKKDGVVLKQYITKANPESFFALGNADDMKDILDNLLEDETAAVESKQDEINLILNIDKKDELNIAKGLEADDMQRAFFITPSLDLEYVRNGEVSKKDIDKVYSLNFSLEIPKKDKNYANYTVISYKETGDEVVTQVVDSLEKNGRISFILSTDESYGIFYDKTYQIVFKDYNKEVLDIQYVKIGTLPEEPEEPTRDGYEFVSWDKALEPATKDTIYIAEYEISSFKLMELEDEFERVMGIAREKLESGESKYTKASYRKLEKVVDQSEVVMEALLERATSIAKIENEIQKVKDAMKALEIRKATVSSSGLAYSSGSSDHKTAVAKNVPLSIVPIVGSWEKTGDTYRMLQNGSYVKNAWGYTNGENGKKLWYNFDEQGNMRTGWYQNHAGIWYYMCQEKNENEGLMLTGWVWITSADNKQRCYYLNPDLQKEGALAVNTTIDGYSVNENGAWVVNGIEQVR